MRVAAVESSTLAAVGYDAGKKLLHVEFCSGTVYHYVGVPAAVHEELLAALSKGRYFNDRVRGRFPCRLTERPGMQAAAAGRGGRQ